MVGLRVLLFALVMLGFRSVCECALVCMSRHTGGNVKGMPRRTWGKITRKSKRFYTEYTGPDSKRHTPGHSFAARGDAEGWLALERRLIDLDAWQPPAARAAKQEADSLTVGEWMDTYLTILATRVKPSTLQTYRREVRNRITAPLPPGDGDPRVNGLKDVPLTALTTARVYEWWDGALAAYPVGRTPTQHA